MKKLWYINNENKQYRFPKQDEIKKKWIESIKKDNFSPSVYSVVCSLHFTEDCFLRKVTKICLKADAIASLFLNDFEPNKVSENSIKCDHTYCLPSQKCLKRKLDKAIDDVETLKKRLRAMKVQKERATKKASSLSDVIQTLKDRKLLSVAVCEVLKDCSSKVPSQLIQRLLDNNLKPGIRKKLYQKELKAFAVTLQFYSSKAYNFVRNTFDLALPHENVIRRWYSSVKAEPGFTEESFLTLEAKVKEESYLGNEVIVALTFDEMSIRKWTHFDGTKFIGCVDMGIYRWFLCQWPYQH